MAQVEFFAGTKTPRRATGLDPFTDSLFSFVSARRTDSGADIPSGDALRGARGDVVERLLVLLRIGVLGVNHGEFGVSRLIEEARGIHDAGKCRRRPTGSTYLGPS